MSGPDVGRAAVYAAEEMAFGGTDAEDERSITELAAVGHAVTTGEWWRAAGGPTVRVMAARPDAASSSARPPRAGGTSPVEVRLAAGQATVATLAHELAHALAGVERGHGPVFRAAHIDVCAVVAGGRAATLLSTAYRELGVPAARRSWSSPVRVTGEGFAVLP